MNIQFANLKQQYFELRDEIDTAVQNVLFDCNFILGDGVKIFEIEFANYCGLKYGVGVHSGLSSLELALKVIGIKSGDEVITVANSFIATALAISNVGAKVILVDCGEDMLIDVSKIEEAITPKTKAIIPVHLFGQISNMLAIRLIANKYGLKIIEDASQAHGATQYGEVGGYSDMMCFSLYPSKNLGAFSDAGIILTNNEEYYNKLIKLRNYGGTKYHHDIIGTNSRLSTLNARVLSVKLRKLNEWNTKRELIAVRYGILLSGVGDIKLPFVVDRNTHVFHQFVIQTERRDELQQYLKEHGISTLIHYPVPIHKQKCYPELNHLSFPITERLAKTILSLPIHQYLTLEEIEFICDTIKNFYNGKN